MWRELYENEKEILLKRYTYKVKNTIWFVYLWMGIGILAIAFLAFRMILAVIQEGFFAIPYGLLMIFFVYLFTIKFGKSILYKGFRMELDSLNNNEARAYEATLIEVVRRKILFSNSKCRIIWRDD